MQKQETSKSQRPELNETTQGLAAYLPERTSSTKLHPPVSICQPASMLTRLCQPQCGAGDIVGNKMAEGNAAPGPVIQAPTIDNLHTVQRPSCVSANHVEMRKSPRVQTRKQTQRGEFPVHVHRDNTVQQEVGMVSKGSHCELLHWGPLPGQQ